MNKQIKYGRLFRIAFISLLLFIRFIYFEVNQKTNKKKIKYDLIIPINPLDVQKFMKHKIFYEKFLNFTNIILITSLDAKKFIENDSSIIFINEDIIIQKEKINEFLNKTRFIMINRVGWYEQQFIKMAYARICKNEYYLVWDADTIPIKFIEMFKNEQPFFDMKMEHHFPYFNTMERIIPKLNYVNKSFISEHMIIKTDFMKSLLDNIEMNHKLTGKLFWEKILFAIDINDINGSGFSEYETYGTYVNTRYPNAYIQRNWHSLRDAERYFGEPENLNLNDINWLSQDYHALSFEYWTPFNIQNLPVVKNYSLQKMYKPENFFNDYDKIFLNHTKIENM